MTWIRQWSNEWGERWEGAYGKDASPHPAREDAPHIQMLDDAMRELYEEYPKEITAVRLMSLVRQCRCLASRKARCTGGERREKSYL